MCLRNKRLLDAALNVKLREDLTQQMQLCSEVLGLNEQQHSEQPASVCADTPTLKK